MACAELSTREKLDVLQLTWLTWASNARMEALIEPGGFQTERARQVEVLREMADLISFDEPDLEMERLYHENDIAGMVRHVQKLADDMRRPTDDQQDGEQDA